MKNRFISLKFGITTYSIAIYGQNDYSIAEKSKRN